MGSFIRLALICTLAASPSPLVADSAIPQKALDFIDNYCLDCHDADTSKGDLNLEIESVNWSSPSIRHHWEDLFARVSRHKMPPPKKSQPSDAERAAFIAWLDGILLKESPIGGTPMRRLNHREFHRAITTTFSIKDFELPGGFPLDLSAHGFDTTAADLVVSPSHVEAYAETAIIVADYIFPPVTPPPAPKKWSIPPADMTVSYSSCAIVDGAMRLASTGGKTRNTTWPTKFTAPASGRYTVTVEISAKNPPAEQVPEFVLGAHAPYERGSKDRVLTRIPVPNESPKTVTVDLILFQGETLLFSYANAPLDYTKGAGKYRPFLQAEFARTPLLAAAWAKVGKVPRGGNGWARVKATMRDDKTLNSNIFSPGSPQVEKVIKTMAGNPVGSGETIVYKYFEEGPNLGIHKAAVSGPHELVEDDRIKQQKAIQATFFGKQGRSTSDADIRTILTRILVKAFRRPVATDEVSPYLMLVKRELTANRRLDDGYHLAIRAMLTSPNFLFRERGDTLDDYEFAGRLSYFLHGRQPDAKLLAKADKGALTKSTALRAEAERMLKNKSLTLTFIRDFTGQWLDVNALDTLMPDPKLFPRFSKAHRDNMKREVELTFEEILKENRPVLDFIDPDFLYTDSSLGMHLYELDQFMPKKGAKKGKQIKIPAPDSVRRISIERGTRRGGLLTMPAVMTATANGVDTQPVLRGVWTLENILGMPPPKPPKAVPALPPNTAGAKSPKERLAAHMASSSCASCHQDIDPVGFVLENFDAVGRWRTEYPTRTPKEKTIPVDATGVLPDGTELRTITDLKKWLVDHPEHFSTCLASKLMAYATGRHLNHHERKIIATICDNNLKNNEGFRDLLLNLIDSEVFRAR